MNDRFKLAKERINEILTENILPLPLKDFFIREAEFILLIFKAYELSKSGELKKLSLSELRKLNKDIYAFYDNDRLLIKDDSFLFEGADVLFALSAELKAMIPYVFEADLYNILIRAELYLQMYSAFISSSEAPDINDTGVIKRCDEYIYPTEKELRDILYFYVSDYTHEATKEKIENMVSLSEDFATQIIMNEDLSDLRTLYYFGEYVTENEERTLSHLGSLSDDKLQKIADTFTEGYRLGFIATNKDLSKKKIVNIRYCLGFEPVIRLAVKNFEKMGLKPVIYRAHQNLLTGRGMVRNGYYGAIYNKQYDFEHKDDGALILDKKLITIRLEALSKYFEENKENAYLFAGPAVMEIFGEAPKELKSKDYAPTLSKKQQEMLVEYAGRAMEIQNKYIIEEERSFTIIAFPTPEIGDEYERIFDEVVRLNTLDYKLYRDVQQIIINTLDKAEYVSVKGKGENKTDIKISLNKLDAPDKQTNFENCVADVNIPVGEVFTSPVLKGTEGTLNVSRVFLNGLEYKNLTIKLKDGMISEYSCDNFESAEDNKKYISDNVLFHHKTLPVGEFAIGTNTTAYVMARKFGIEDRLPILIAEKTGPHLAFGDTCYSHEEEVKTYNPDGKEIIAKENECSKMRDTEPLKAYFNCHTDVTLPYDELSRLCAVTPLGESISIIENGRFVLEGTELLNEPFENHSL